MKAKCASPAEALGGMQRATDNDEKCIKALAMEREGKDWIRRNPDIWERFTTYALNEAAHQRRVSIKWLLEDARKFDRVDSAGDPVKVDNSLAPFFARQLIDEHPEIRPYLETRKSILDRLA